MKRKWILGALCAVVISAGGGVAFNHFYSNEDKKAIVSSSLAYSYNSLEALTESADLIAEVEINEIYKEIPKDDLVQYKVSIKDVIKGTTDSDQIILNFDSPALKEGYEVISDNPDIRVGENDILFLKKASDPSVESLYYISGVYQGRFEVIDGAVQAVNPNYGRQLADSQNQAFTSQGDQQPVYIPGESLEDFKKKISDIETLSQ